MAGAGGRQAGGRHLKPLQAAGGQGGSIRSRYKRRCWHVVPQNRGRSAGRHIRHPGSSRREKQVRKGGRIQVKSKIHILWYIAGIHKVQQYAQNIKPGGGRKL